MSEQSPARSAQGAEPDDAPRDGRSTRWDPHRRRRRLAIITAAIEAIGEFGPEASTAQIAERAGVPRTHVYRHFEGKQALDLAVSSHVAAQIGEQIRTGLATRGSARAIIRVDRRAPGVDRGTPEPLPIPRPARVRGPHSGIARRR